MHNLGPVDKSDLPYRTLFENLRYGTAYCQLFPSVEAPEDFLFLAVNPTLQKLAGEIPLAGKWISSAVPQLKDQVTENLGLLRTVVRTSRPQNLDIWLNNPRRCLSVSLFPAGTDRFILVVDEIAVANEEVSTEGATPTASNRQVPGMVFQLSRSPKGRYSFPYVSSGAVSVFEIAPTDLMKNPGWIFRRIHPQDVKTFFRRVHGAALKHEPFHAEFRVVLAQRGLRWLRADSVPEQREDGTLLWHGVIADITDEREGHFALEESQRFLENIINSVADPIFVKERPGGPFLLVNQAFCDLLGITRLELEAADRMIAFPESERLFFDQIDEQVFVTGLENIVQEPLTDKRGVVHTIVTKKTLYVDEQGRKFLVGVCQDITERLKAEELQLRSQKMESLGALAGGIAHDFNNLLASLFAYLELAKGSVSNGQSEKALHYLSKTLSVFDRAKALTQQLLTFSKGGSPLRQNRNLERLIKTRTDALLTGSTAKSHYAIPDDLWPCECDENQIAQVIDNLVTNALQAMPDGGTIFIEAGNVETAHGPFVKLTIRDQGIGIPPESLPRIFDPFFSTKPNGQGLGLATVHSIVLKHGGWVEVESEPNLGTVFHVFIPASPVIEPFAPSPVKGPHSGSGRILLMDDEDLLREAMQAMLEGLGYSVTATRNGVEALKRYREARRGPNPYVAAILDLTIPHGMGGSETAQAIRRDHRDAVLIAASGYPDDPVMSDPLAHGFSDRIVKPFLKGDLEDLLNRVFHPEL